MPTSAAESAISRRHFGVDETAQLFADSAKVRAIRA